MEFPRHRERRPNPSFSSSLLDAIYRSIDQNDLHLPPAQPYHNRHHSKKEQVRLSEEDSTKDSIRNKEGGSDRERYKRRPCTVEKCTADIMSENYLVARRDSTNRSFVPMNSSSSSSDSSGFSSSESEFAGSRSSSSCYSLKRPKPIRTSISSEHPRTREFRRFLQARSDEKPCVSVKIPQRDGPDALKSRLTKSYGDSKKVRQPISPGGKLANFLNSIFNAKKARISVPSITEPSDHSTCSSASSFSRSCLSKTPSSTSSSIRRKSAEKRSVRFGTVSFILDEDCRPCGHKKLEEGNESKRNFSERVAERSFDVLEENRRVAEAAREMLRNYQKRKESHDDREFHHHNDEDDDDDDVASCASSDLFELDNLGVVELERFREELPVYGTTSVGANLAIANGLLM